MDLRTSFSFYVSYCCSWFIQNFILNEIKSLLFQWNFSFPKYFLSFCGFQFHSNLYFYTNFAHFYVFLFLSTFVCIWQYYIQTQCSESNLCNCRFYIICPLWFKCFNDNIEIYLSICNVKQIYSISIYFNENIEIHSSLCNMKQIYSISIYFNEHLKYYIY